LLASAALLTAAIVPGITVAQEAGDQVLKRGEILEDLYAAGGTVDVDARVDGDVVIAGGELRVAGSISQDVMMAGGRLDLRARVEDDARLAGGRITVDAAIGDHLVAAGGRIELFPGTSIDGPAWLAGGDVTIAGTVQGPLKAAGAHVRLAGTIAGDAELTGEHLELLAGSRIGGSLTYRSPEQIVMADGAEVAGDITYLPFERPSHEPPALAIGVTWVIVMTFTGLLLVILLPSHSHGAIETLQTDPLKSLGLGAAFVLGAPLAVVLLSALIIGIPAGLALLALYPVLLLVGYLTTALALGERGTRWTGRQAPVPLTGQALALLLALTVLTLLQAIPLLGALVMIVALMAGTGGNLLAMLRRRQAGD
jgi:cytoskeletal protein CcmA (bactofilin family)